MVTSFMLRKQYGEKLSIVDLGYVTHPETQKVGEILSKHIGKKHFQADCDGILKVDITIKKEKLLGLFKQIIKGGKHWHSDYHWKHKDDMPYDVKSHPQNIRD